MVEKELVAMLRDCRNELCLRCGAYHEAHNGACNGCRWRDMSAIEKDKESVDKSQTKKRTAQFYSDDSDLMWSNYIPKMRNPCGCGANCFHYEYDGSRMIGVCNGCDADIYLVEKVFIAENLQTGIWKEIDKLV